MVEETMKARPKHDGKDPLAEGVRLHNVSNSSNADSYVASENEVVAVRAKGVGGSGVPMPVMPAHKIRNSNRSEQMAVAKGRVEKPAKIVKKSK